MRYTRFRRTSLSLMLCLTLFLAVLPTITFAQASASLFTVDDLLGVININAADLSEDGRWLVATASTLSDRIGIDNYRFGDPTYIAPSLSDVWVIDTQTGKQQKLFSTKQQTRNPRWSPDATKLALFVFRGQQFEPQIWDKATGKITPVALPQGMYAAENSDLHWSQDGAKLFLALRKEAWRTESRTQFEAQTRAPIVVQSSKDAFLAWDDLRRRAAVRTLISYDLKTAQTREVIAETRLSNYDITEDNRLVTYSEDITKKTDYDVIFGVDNQLRVQPTAGGESRILIKSTKGLNLIWSKDGRRYAYAKDGNLFVGSVEDKEPRQLTGKPEDKTKADAEKAKEEKEDDKQKKEKERFTAVRLNAQGEGLIASNKEGLWLIDTATGAKELFLPFNEEDKEAPRYQVIEWHAETNAIYLSYAARTKWERGLVRYNTKEKKLEELRKDAQLYFGMRLSKDGRTFVFQSATGNRPADLYVADANFKTVRRLTDSNPQLQAKRLSKTELISYLDSDGVKSYGVVYYPADYEAGKKYPTIFNIYEQFFDDNFSGTINVLTANGYVVVQPSVNFETGYPGEAWVKGVTAAANKVIEMGIADAERLGVQGTSYGGYATNLLITQTNRFKAAINISGKVNMVSFYTDSPRLGVRNIHAPEKSQDRIGATLWQQPQKYIEHSAVMFADRIKTPLLLMTGEQDHNVPARQAMEMYYALRRLGKEVEWVSYTNGGHGMPTTTVAEVKDYHQRIVKWYDDHLKGDLKKKAEAQKPDAGQ